MKAKTSGSIVEEQNLEGQDLLETGLASRLLLASLAMEGLPRTFPWCHTQDGFCACAGSRMGWVARTESFSMAQKSLNL